MPFFTGNSVAGAQDEVTIGVESAQWVSLSILGQPFDEFKRRHGLMLIGFPNPGGSFRVIETFRIFGGGLFVLPRWPVTGVNAMLVLDWYVSELEWRLDVPFNPVP